MSYNNNQQSYNQYDYNQQEIPMSDNNTGGGYYDQYNNNNNQGYGGQYADASQQGYYGDQQMYQQDQGNMYANDGGHQQDAGWFQDQNTNYSQGTSSYGNTGYNQDYYGGSSSQSGNQKFTSTGFEPPPPAPVDQFNTDSSNVISGGEGFGSFADEPPLLEELGINFSHIYSTTLAVIVPTRDVNEQFLAEADMAGPLVFCIIQAIILTLKLQLHLIGYVFGFGVIGCGLLYMVVNLMNHATPHSISIYPVVSILGYNLLPMVGLSAITVIINLQNLSMLLPLTFVAVMWSTATATRFFETATHMKEQRYLIGYPVFLFYSIYALISVF